MHTVVHVFNCMALHQRLCSISMYSIAIFLYEMQFYLTKNSDQIHSDSECYVWVFFKVGIE
jgi:hypothetical protein